jgi:hypothetical protein
MRYYFVATRPEDVDLLKEEGAKYVLCSYAYLRRWSERSMDKLEGIEVMVDSGAYTAWHAGKEITLEDYSEFLRAHTQLRTYVSLDVLEMENDSTGWLARDKTLSNYHEMKAMGLNPIPVWHEYYDYYYLDEYMKDSDWICLAGFERLGLVQARFQASYIKLKYPDYKFHLLGTTDIRFINWFKPFSVDSAYWGLEAMYKGRKLIQNKGGAKKIGTYIKYYNTYQVKDFGNPHKKWSVSSETIDKRKRVMVRAIIQELKDNRKWE